MVLVRCCPVQTHSQKLRLILTGRKNKAIEPVLLWFLRWNMMEICLFTINSISYYNSLGEVITDKVLLYLKKNVFQWILREVKEKFSFHLCNLDSHPYFWNIIHTDLKNKNIIKHLLLCCSVAKLCPTLWPHGLQHAGASLPLTISWSLPKFMSTESVIPSNHIIL